MLVTSLPGRMSGGERAGVLPGECYEARTERSGIVPRLLRLDARLIRVRQSHQSPYVPSGTA
jgi:hypothetical protein